MQIAEKTLKLFEDTVHADQGNSYRYYLQKVMPHIEDAYRQDDFPFRSHLGASVIGGECARNIWYDWRWSHVPNFPGRIMRLFNRGHMEEGRFIALLLACGIGVYQQDSEGHQFRISRFGGHFGGSGDGKLAGVPDVPSIPLVLAEMKTISDKYAGALEKKGVRAEKFEHFVQMQIYMHEMQLPAALYLSVNKNNDNIHGEIVMAEPAVAEQFIARAGTIIFMYEPPPKISTTPGYYKCRFCDNKNVCHNNVPPTKTCRSCVNALVKEDGTWACDKHKLILDKDAQYMACNDWSRLF